MKWGERVTLSLLTSLYPLIGQIVIILPLHTHTHTLTYGWHGYAYMDIDSQANILVRS